MLNFELRQCLVSAKSKKVRENKAGHSASRAHEFKWERGDCHMQLHSFLSCPCCACCPQRNVLVSQCPYGEVYFLREQEQRDSRNATVCFFLFAHCTGMVWSLYVSFTFLWRGHGDEMQSLESHYTTKSKTFQCWIPHVLMYELTENFPFRVSLQKQT